MTTYAFYYTNERESISKMPQIFKRTIKISDFVSAAYAVRSSRR